MAYACGSASRPSELPQRPELRRSTGEFAQLWQFGEGAADVAGPDVREALGDVPDHLGWDAEGEAGVAQGVPGPVGLGHPGDRGPLLAESLDDRVIHLRRRSDPTSRSMSGSDVRRSLSLLFLTSGGCGVAESSARAEVEEFGISLVEAVEQTDGVPAGAL